MCEKRRGGILWTCGIAALLIGLDGVSAGAQNLLDNPSFETPGEQGVPASWTREYHPQMSGPFRVGEEAQDGRAAVCLMTEEWVFDRPQFITQEVPLPPFAKGGIGGVQQSAALRLAAWGKGQGLLQLAIQFRQGGQPLETKTLAPDAIVPVEYVLPVETEKVFNLGREYREYEVLANVPEEADSVRVRLGNTIGERNTTNIWGLAWIDRVSLTPVDTVKPPATTPSHPVTKTLTPPPDSYDVARYARILTNPPSLNLKFLIDGDEETALAFFPGTERYGSITFLFPVALPICHVSLHLRGNVNALTIRGDPQGEGRFPELLARAEGLAGVKDWVAIETPNLPVHAICVEPAEGEGLYGYHTTSPWVDEVKVYVPAQDVRPQEGALAQWAAFRPAPAPPAGVPSVTLEPILSPGGEGDGRGGKGTEGEGEVKRFGKMMCADLWMWGIDATKPDVPVEDYRKTEGFRTTADFCHRMGVDTIYVDLHVSAGSNLVPWPSQVCPGTHENVLEALIEALHAEGFKVYVELLSNHSPPFERAYWHYPKEETSRYPQMQQFPSIIHGWHYRDHWLRLLDEVMACGADGVALCTDEHYYKGHFMETFPADDPARPLYRERFGHDLPEHEGDTLAFRQWITMRHEDLCKLYGYWSAELRKKYPQIYLGSNFMGFNAACSYLIETGLPLDLLGAFGGLTELGSDYMGPYGIRAMSAANGWRRGTMWFDGNMWGPIVGGPQKPEMEFYGEVLWSVMYGLGSMSFWRYNYVVENGNAPAVTRAYSMLHDLEALGVWDARPPQRIALLTSRASLDWWQIRAWWGQHDEPDWDRGVEGMRGWFAEQAVFNLLQQNGYPFDWFFLDRLDQLQNLEDYQVLLLPFAWSVSLAAAERVKAAAAKGARVFLFDGQMGPTDEWGEPHPSPVFKDLVDSGQATLFPDDLLTWGATDVWAEKVLKALDEALGEARPWTFHRYGQRVDATVLQKSPQEVFLFLLNWEKQAVATVDLGLSLPAGHYQAIARDETRWHRVLLDGQDVLTSEQLRNFRLRIGPCQPYVVYVRGVQ